MNELTASAPLDDPEYSRTVFPMEPSMKEEVQEPVSETSVNDLKRSGDIVVQARRFSTRRHGPEKRDEKTKMTATNFISQIKNGLKDDDMTDTNDTEEEENAVLHQGTIALVSLDRRACARSQMQDANALFDQLVLPSCLPWSQCQNMLFKTFPRDIDDLPSVLMEGTEETAAAYRSSDPGVVTLRTRDVAEVDTTQRRKPKRKRYEMDVRAESPFSASGEWSVQMYHEVQWNQRQQEEYSIPNERIISIRVGSTSSRASIFDSSYQPPLFLMAIYPRQLHEGTKRHGLEAYDYGVNLGSYNCRPLPPKESVLLSDIPSSKHRFLVGRSRIMWSEKERPESKSQRCAYRSILNGQRLDNTSLKRPLQVKVGIRINKVLLCYSGNRTNPLEVSAVTNKNRKRLESPSFSYASKVIQDSLNFGCGSVEAYTSQKLIAEESALIAHDYSQCTMNVEKYSSFREDSNVLARREPAWNEPFTIDRFVSKSTHGDHGFLRVKVHKNCVQAAEKSFHTQLRIVPPRLDLLPSEDGQIHVSCTVSGTMTYDTEVESTVATSLLEDSNGQATQVSSVLLRALASEVGRCVICWNSLFKEILYNCQGCRASAHYTCVNVTSYLTIDRDDWLCSSCASIGENRVCGLCYFPEGTLLPWKNNQWIHNVCRTWCGIDGTTHMLAQGVSDKDNPIGMVCHLCSKVDTPVVVCMGEDCSVRFHPMCAVVATMAQEIRCFELNEPLPQYTLIMMRTTFSSEGQFANSKVLPVAFCPYHSPVQRCHPTFHSGAVRIPPRRHQWESHPTTN